MLANLLSAVKTNPVTTVSGWLAIVSGWLSQQPLLEGHPSASNLLKVAALGGAAIFAAFTKDHSK